MLVADFTENYKPNIKEHYLVRYRLIPNAKKIITSKQKKTVPFYPPTNLICLL